MPTMTDRGTDLLQIQEAIGASDEEIAALAGLSKTTLRRAMRGQASDKSKRKALEALETYRVTQIDRLTRTKCKAVG